VVGVVAKNRCRSAKVDEKSIFDVENRFRRLRIAKNLDFFQFGPHFCHFLTLGRRFFAVFGVKTVKFLRFGVKNSLKTVFSTHFSCSDAVF